MKKRSLAGLIALFLAIAFLAVSCDSPVGGGKSGNGDGGGGTSKPNATPQDYKTLDETLEDDDWEAIEIALGPPLPEFNHDGEVILENGMTFDGDVETSGIITYTKYKDEGYNTGKELTLNGIRKFEISIDFTKVTSKVTVSGSTNGPIKSDVVQVCDENNRWTANGVVTIGNKNYDVNDIVAVRDGDYDFDQDEKDDENNGNTENNGNNGNNGNSGNTGNNGNNGSGSIGNLTAQQFDEFFAFSEFFFGLVEEIPMMFASEELPNGIEYDLHTNSTTFDNYTLENGATISGTITNEVEMDSNYQPISICQKTDLTLTGMSITTYKANMTIDTIDHSVSGTITINGVELDIADIMDEPSGPGSGHPGDDDDDDYPDYPSTDSLEIIAYLEEKFALELTEDDLAALTIAVMPDSIVPTDNNGMPVTGNGFSFETDMESYFSGAFNEYKYTTKEGKILTINGTLFQSPEGGTTNLTVAGSTNGPVKYDESSDEYQSTITIGTKTFNMTEGIWYHLYLYGMANFDN